MLSPEEWHERNHDFLSRPAVPMDECRRCQMALIKCRGKVTYASVEAAWESAKALNLERGPTSLVRTYRCRWCLRWHLTGRMSKHQNRRAEKHRRKALRVPA